MNEPTGQKERSGSVMAYFFRVEVAGTVFMDVLIDLSGNISRSMRETTKITISAVIVAVFNV